MEGRDDGAERLKVAHSFKGVDGGEGNREVLMARDFGEEEFVGEEVGG